MKNDQEKKPLDVKKIVKDKTIMVSFNFWPLIRKWIIKKKGNDDGNKRL